MNLCFNGDGEPAEGSIWESAMAAGHIKVDNAIVDQNHLQIMVVLKLLWL